MTILSVHGLRVVIFLNDYDPAHVHIFGAGGAKINLVGPDGRVQLVSAEGMKCGDVRRAMTIVSEHRDALLEHWRRIHG